MLDLRNGGNILKALLRVSIPIFKLTERLDGYHETNHADGNRPRSPAIVRIKVNVRYIAINISPQYHNVLHVELC